MDSLGDFLFKHVEVIGHYAASANASRVPPR